MQRVSVSRFSTWVSHKKWGNETYSSFPFVQKPVGNQQGSRYNKARPTHFLSLRIDSPHIVDGVQQMQDDIVLRYPQLQPYLTPAIKSHFTLFILNLPNSESIEKAKQTLAACQEIFKQHYTENSCAVNIGGLGTFNDKVVFVGLEESESKKKLQEFVHAMYLPFKEAGLTCDELKKPWTPHCTIMKLSKGKKHGHRNKNNNKNSNDNNNENSNNETEEVIVVEETNNSNSSPAKPKFVPVHKIDKAAYAKHKEIQFGSHVFAGVELSAMSAVDPDGYYQCLHRELFEMPLSSSVASSSTTSSSTTPSSTTSSSTTSSSTTSSSTTSSSTTSSSTTPSSTTSSSTTSSSTTPSSTTLSSTSSSTSPSPSNNTSSSSS